MTVIYVLQLEAKKIYVGRINKDSVYPDYPEDHFNNDGNFWTKKYKPLYILEYYDHVVIDNVVLKYMKIYGIDNVRGGSYNSMLIDNKKVEIRNKLYNKYKYLEKEVKEVKEVEVYESCLCTIL